MSKFCQNCFNSPIFLPFDLLACLNLFKLCVSSWLIPLFLVVFYLELIYLLCASDIVYVVVGIFFTDPIKREGEREREREIKENKNWEVLMFGVHVAYY